MKNIGFIGYLVLFFCCNSSSNKNMDKSSHLRQFQANCADLYVSKKPTKPNDWLAEHKETYQSFLSYQESKPIRPNAQRKNIYIMRMGNFTPKQREIIQQTIEYLGCFYGLSIQEIPLPEKADIHFLSRINEYTGEEQLYTRTLMDSILSPTLPQDAVVLIGLCSADLYPHPNWNFVYGEASMKKRVGVWSMHRFGNPENNEDDYRLCLLRTLNTATHEIGHIFSIPHCTKYECCMNGSNHQEESDNHPAWFCVECAAKLCWNLDYDINLHLEKVGNFWKQNDFPDNAAFYEKNQKRIR